MSRSPYDVLGVNPTDTFENITQSYNTLVKILHPDKSDGRFVMSREEQTRAYNEVREAYKKIRELNKINKRNFNKFDKEYKVGNDFKINSVFSSSDGDISPEKFNQAFEEHLSSIDKSDAVSDPSKRGYAEFSSSRYASSGPIRAVPVYSGSVDISEKEKMEFNEQRKQRSRLDLAVRLPDELGFELGPSCAFSNCQELGVTNIADFSMRTTGKASICGTDLMSAFADTECWEQIASRNPDAISKFTSTEEVGSMASKMRSARETVKVDPEIDRLLKAKSIIEKTTDAARMNAQKIRDDYYNDLNAARLSNH